jgi:hypothetical protein
MSERREDEAETKPPRGPDEGRGWMAEFEEDLRRMHVEQPKPRRLTSLLLGKLRKWRRRGG